MLHLNGACTYKIPHFLADFKHPITLLKERLLWWNLPLLLFHPVNQKFTPYLRLSQLGWCPNSTSETSSSSSLFCCHLSPFCSSYLNFWSSGADIQSEPAAVALRWSRGGPILRGQTLRNIVPEQSNDCWCNASALVADPQQDLPALLSETILDPPWMHLNLHPWKLWAVCLLKICLIKQDIGLYYQKCT